VVHLETRIQFDLGKRQIKPSSSSSSNADSDSDAGLECLLSNTGESVTCMDFVACQKYTGIGLSDKLEFTVEYNLDTRKMSPRDVGLNLRYYSLFVICS
jgi:hypothetical protein